MPTHRLSDRCASRVIVVGHTIGSARYVSLTTFRRNGDPVSVPVWIAPALPGPPFRDGELVFVSLEDTYKVKRLRRDPRVELRECDARGRVAPGAVPVTGTGRVLSDPDDVRAVKRAIGEKYGSWYHVFAAAESVVMRVWPRYKKRAGIAISLDPGVA